MEVRLPLTSVYSILSGFRTGVIRRSTLILIGRQALLPNVSPMRVD